MRKNFLLILLFVSICMAACPEKCSVCINGYCKRCNKDYFLDGSKCLQCEISTCKSCNGTDICASCPDGIKLEDNKCIRCEDASKMVINKKCVDCVQVGCSSCSIADGTMCNCQSEIDLCCNTENNVYQGSGSCIACDKYIGGCGSCIGEMACTSCIDGYVRTTDEDLVKCENIADRYYVGIMFIVLAFVI